MRFSAISAERDLQAKEAEEVQRRLEAKNEEVQRRLDAKDAELLGMSSKLDALSAANEEMLKQLSGLKDEQQQRMSELKFALLKLQETEESAELTSLQLFQVQQEMKYYFDLSGKQKRILEQSEDLQSRLHLLLSGLIG